MKKISRIVGITSIIGLLLFSHTPAFADTGLGLSPMNNKIVLNPGDTYGGDVTIINQSTDNEDLFFKIEVIPFYVDNEYKNIFGEEIGNYNQLAKWITLDKTEGMLAPGDSTKVHYNINVPTNAPAGGQYAAIRALDISSENSNDEIVSEMSTTVKTVYGVSYLIMAEIAGETNRTGEILDSNLTSFLLSGNITGSSVIKNTGNVHGTAKYTLQVYPLFSNEEIYTNEEHPDERNVMPEREYYHETVWNETPPVGIFNVIYTVDFEGVTTQVSKMVIICPIWLLFIIIFVIITIVIWIVMKIRSKGNKKARRASESKAE